MAEIVRDQNLCGFLDENSTVCCLEIGHDDKRHEPKPPTQLTPTSMVLKLDDALRTIKTSRSIVVSQILGSLDEICDPLNHAIKEIDAVVETLRRRLDGPFTLRDLHVGTNFRFKKPPVGWSSDKIGLVAQMPGFAVEGWDFIPIDLLDSEVEVIRTLGKAHWEQ